MTGYTVNVLAVSWAGTLQRNWPGKFWMYLQCTGQVYGGYIIHFLAMYLQCTGPVHHPLPPVRAQPRRKLNPNHRVPAKFFQILYFFILFLCITIALLPFSQKYQGISRPLPPLDSPGLASPLPLLVTLFLCIFKWR